VDGPPSRYRPIVTAPPLPLPQTPQGSPSPVPRQRSRRRDGGGPRAGPRPLEVDAATRSGVTARSTHPPTARPGPTRSPSAPAATPSRRSTVTFPAGGPAPHGRGPAQRRGPLGSRVRPGRNERSQPCSPIRSCWPSSWERGVAHILVRFSPIPTDGGPPDTLIIVIVLLGAFYVFPAVYGAWAVYAPRLYFTRGRPPSCGPSLAGFSRPRWERM